MKQNFPYPSVHFVGIFGSGMSALAQYLAWTGVHVTGSDRFGESEDTKHIKEKLEAAGCKIFAQDGSGLSASTAAICLSTAIEDSNPDLAAAHVLGIPVLHRSDILAQLVKSKKTIAVAGTSGKSTVTAMIFELLAGCGKSPSLISGAGLRSLEAQGYLGNAYFGDSDLLVVEADESDGSLVKYEPYGTLILNLSKDHKPVPVVYDMFKQLLCQSQWRVLNGDDRKLDGLERDETFGFREQDSFKAVKKDSDPFSSTLSVDEVVYSIPLPGEHNCSNLLAAICVCRHLGCDSTQLAEAAKAYQGVDRRFALSRTASHVTVIDDFAHNPEKIRAAVLAAQRLSRRIIALYQPHGFGPTRFLKYEYATTFNTIFRPDDCLCLLPIYYAGGTATKDITSGDIIDLMEELQIPSFLSTAVDNRLQALSFIKQQAHPGDVVLLMGARDPSLSGFAEDIKNLFN